MYIKSKYEQLYQHPRSRKYVVEVLLEDGEPWQGWVELGAYRTIEDAYGTLEEYRAACKEKIIPTESIRSWDKNETITKG